MRLTGKAAMIAGLLIAVTIAQAALTVVRDEGALTTARAVSQKDNAFNRAVQSMDANFYGYDDQLNMYALVAQEKNQNSLAQTTYRQAISFRNQFEHDLTNAQHLAFSAKSRDLLASVGRDISRYNQDANIVRKDDQSGRFSQATYEQTLGNIALSNATMPLLKKVVELGDSRFAADLQQIRKDQQAAITWAWVETIVMLAILVAMLIVIQLYAVRPLVALRRTARHLSQGNVSDQVGISSKDELGDLGQAFREMMSYLGSAGQVANAISQGDLTVTPTPRGDKDILGQALTAMHSRLRELLDDLQVAGHDVQSSVDELASVARQTTDATRQIATAINQTAQATGESSQGLQQIASAMQQLKTAVEQVTEGTDFQAEQAQRGEHSLGEMKTAQSSVQQAAGRMEQLALKSRQTAQDGRRQMEETLSAMTRIAEVTRTTAEAISLLGKHSDRIGAIAGTISEIASQTNLLALNANIEAARAGEHGRGFAVVADEVRKLAEQSSQEATNVSDLIRTIQQTVQQSVLSMEKGQQEVQNGQSLGEETRTALHQMDTAVSQVAEEIGTLADTIRVLEHQSAGVDQGIREIARIAQENSAAAQQMAASSTSVTDTVEGLAAISEQTAASTEEVATTGEHVAESAESLAEKARVLGKVAERLNSLVAQYQL